MRRKLAFLAIPALLSLAVVPGSAVAAASPTYVVAADQPAASPAGHLYIFNDFFPRALVVPQGATIVTPIEGFHTFTLLATGTTAAQDMAASGIGATDPEDTTPNLNGTMHIQERLVAIAPELPSAGCGTPASPCSFDGTKTISSGGPGDPSAPPFTVTVNAAPGTYVFHCRIHAHMVGSLVVVPAGSSSAETPAQAAAHAVAQTKTDVAEAKVAEHRADVNASSRNADGTTTWHVTAGTVSANRYVSVTEFLPQHIAIKRGDRVVWVAPDSNEPHTITFPADIHTDMNVLCEGPNGTDTPATPTVIPPTGPQDFACGTNPPDEVELGGGNGVRRLTSPATVADSGVISGVGFGPGYGAPANVVIHAWSVTAQPTATPGTYHYVCQFHEGMDATIVIH
ncbi:MAG TPA: hypothetical protein VNF73_13040 [Candidatus Saccharimonadales bacterium]|nr:hypothetical protein [Candidatus Saccharimonadales bacterium]